MLDRQRGGIDLLDAIGRHPGRAGSPELLERAPQPAGPAVDLRLVRQVREHVRPIAADLGQEPILAAAAKQMADQSDGQQLGVSAGRGGAGAARDGQDAGFDRVIDQAVHVDEQQLSCQHDDGLLRRGECDNGGFRERPSR